MMLNCSCHPEVVFSVMCIGGSFGGGNMFQSNQAYAVAKTAFPFLQGETGSLAFGFVLATAVGLVIVGGIRRIGEVAGVLVPLMCGLYVLSGMLILLTHAAAVPAAFATIVREAFSWQAGAGGFAGVLIQGFRRAAFSNEAGCGSAPIAHSAASTIEPVPSSEALKRKRSVAVGARRSITLKVCWNQPPSACGPPGPTTSTLVQDEPSSLEMSTSKTSAFGAGPSELEYQRQ